MISISMITGDTNGSVIFKDSDSELSRLPARISRRATLDGGSIITSSGVSQGDRTFNVTAMASEAQKAAIDYIHKNSISVLASCSEGLFFGALSTINTSTPEVTFTFLVKSKEA